MCEIIVSNKVSHFNINVLPLLLEVCLIKKTKVPKENKAHNNLKIKNKYKAQCIEACTRLPSAQWPH